MSSNPRILCLGAGDGWHAGRLAEAASARDCQLCFASYESLRAEVGSEVGNAVANHDECQLICDAGAVDGFDAILTRTMPGGSLEQITFRLAALHWLRQHSRRVAIVNPPRSLEISIDKFATLAQVARLGYAVPETIVVQSRREAIDAFKSLGGDCVVKPIFGGEGRGVMRIRDAELAWYTFSTLEQLDAVLYVQRFVPPGGCDTRLLVIGDEVIGVRRVNRGDFRTNVASGGRPQAIEPSDEEILMARRICDSIGLSFASVDWIDSDDGNRKVIEVNAIPGWKGTQNVTPVNIAASIIDLLVRKMSSPAEAAC